MTVRHPELHAANEIGAAPADDAIEASKESVAAELVSDLVAFARSNPGVADRVLLYAESRQALLGESGAEAVEEQKKESDRQKDHPILGARRLYLSPTGRSGGGGQATPLPSRRAT